MDYSKLKTPFYKIYVSDSAGENYVKLPNSLMKLVEKVEILETFTSETCMHGSISIVFVEGSREPFVQNSEVNTGDIYGREVELTNKTGMLTDLKFIEAGGILKFSSLVPANIGKIINKASNLVGKLLDTINFSSAPETFGNQKEPTSVAYLFEERNKLKVEWGYLEDSSLTRSVVCSIIAIQSDFPDNDMPRTTVNCHAETYALDQLSIGIGKIFAPKALQPSGFSERGQPIFDFDGMLVGDIVKEICTNIGVDCLVSNSLLNESPAQGTGTIFSPDMTINQFFMKLAHDTNSYYTVETNPKTTKSTIMLIARGELNSTLMSNDTTMLRYRGKNSILKSVSINADFGIATGTKTVGLDKSGKEVSAESNESTVDEVLFEGTNATQADTDPTSHNPSTAAKGFQQNVAKSTRPVSKTIIMPARQDNVGIRESSQVRAACLTKQLVMMEFVTLGFPPLIPGTHIFSGIGERYSGPYHVTNVTHILDKDGYVCRGNGNTNAIYDGNGIPFLSPQSGKTPDTVTTQLFTSLTSSLPGDIGKSSIDAVSGGGSAGQKYKDFKLG